MERNASKAESMLRTESLESLLYTKTSIEWVGVGLKLYIAGCHGLPYFAVPFRLRIICFKLC